MEYTVALAQVWLNIDVDTPFERKTRRLVPMGAW